MDNFTYDKPATVDKAAAAARGDAKFLAGGQSLLAAMKLRLAAPPALVDLSAIPDLKGIKADAQSVTIGAMTRHAEVAASKDVASRIPALAALAGQIGDRQVRNMGTLGGSVAHNDPSSDYPAAVLALGATINTNKRKIAADAYFKGLYETALEAGELIVSVTFPVPAKASYQKFKNAASRFALVGVFVAKTGSGVRVAVTGAGMSGVFRATAIEDALGKSWTPEAAKGVAVASKGLIADIHASAEYRAHLVSVLAGRAVAAA